MSKLRRAISTVSELRQLPYRKSSTDSNDPVGSRSRGSSSGSACSLRSSGGSGEVDGEDSPVFLDEEWGTLSSSFSGGRPGVLLSPSSKHQSTMRIYSPGSAALSAEKVWVSSPMGSDQGRGTWSRCCKAHESHTGRSGSGSCAVCSYCPSDDDSDRIQAFLISIKRGNTTWYELRVIHSGKTVVILRRYSEFREFYHRLLELPPVDTSKSKVCEGCFKFINEVTATFPRRRVFSSQSSSSLDERAKEFNEFLDRANRFVNLHAPACLSEMSDSIRALYFEFLGVCTPADEVASIQRPRLLSSSHAFMNSPDVKKQLTMTLARKLSLSVLSLSPRSTPNSRNSSPRSQRSGSWGVSA